MRLLQPQNFTLVIELHCPMVIILRFFVILVSLLLPAVSGFNSTSEALLSLKSELKDDSNTLSDWIPSKTLACSWSGVICDENSTVVITLDISSRNLTGVLSGKQFVSTLFGSLIHLNFSANYFYGELPSEIFNLTNLKTLDISSNFFSGKFPSGVSKLKDLAVINAFSNNFSGSLPVEVCQLRSLKVLNFAGSYFTGPIPSLYGSFKHLEYIHLAGNLLNGSIPNELGMLRTVKHVEIGYNFYFGGIPRQLGDLTNLQYLDIAGSNLSGPLPVELSNLTNLNSLFLFRNHLTGLIPWEYGKMSPLTSLDLSDNLISGPIPETFSNLKNLRLLSLMCNNMNGSVPEGITTLPLLETLFIWNNFFSGPLPPTLGRYSNLRVIDVSNNNFSGSIPPQICAKGVLLRLILFSNSFTGEIPLYLANCSSLVRLRFEDNSLSGKIALNFSALSSLSYIDLSRNEFAGGIPEELSEASDLEYFNISNNFELGGTIPQQIWDLPLLQNFSASSCNLLGNLPPFLRCKSVSFIELGMNRLSGGIPTSISNCKYLEKMSVKGNNLKGPIPPIISELHLLHVLDISHNHFSGPLPEKFSSSSSLMLLNVSYNDISGMIPSKFKLMGSSAFVGNSKLCGAPLRPCFRGDNAMKKLIWVFLLCAGLFLVVVILVVGIIYFERQNLFGWKMISFEGLPLFTPRDVLRSINSSETRTLVFSSVSPSKVVLPTGITVSLKKIDCEKSKKAVSDFVTRVGNVRHKNLVRLLGFCSNNHQAYLLYDNLPYGDLSEKLRTKRDWTAKYKIIIGIARGLFYLHHDCQPPIPHGNLKTGNILCDENMEPRLSEFGFKYVVQLKDASFPSECSSEKGKLMTNVEEEMQLDVYRFGEIVLEILLNGRSKDVDYKHKDGILGEILDENGVSSSDSSLNEDITRVFDVALLCTSSRPCDRPSMDDSLKILSNLRHQS